MIVGDQKKFTSALIVPTAIDSLKYWCEQHQITWTNLEEIVKNPKVVAKFQELVDKVNNDLSHIEKIKNSPC